MKACVIEFRAEECILRNWSDDLSASIQSIFQPLPEEMSTKRKSFPKSQAHLLVQHFRSIGVAVTELIDDPSEHARYQVWREKLRNPPRTAEESEILSFLTDLGIPIREVQQNALIKLLNCYFGLLSAGCGAGKTLIFLLMVEFLKRIHGGRITAIVMSPSSCASEYRKELENFRGYFSLTLEEALRPNSRANAEIIQNSTADVIIVSVDSAKALIEPIKERLQSFDGHRILNLEEGHSIKSMSSHRSKAVQQVAPLFDRVLVTTATPLPKGPEDVRGYIATIGFPQPVEAYSNGIPQQDFDLLRGIAFVSDETDLPYAPLRTENIEFDDMEELNGAIGSRVRSELAAEHKVVLFCSTNAALVTAFNLFPGVGRTVLSGSYSVTDCETETLLSGRSRDLQKRAIEQFNFDPRCKLLIANYKVGSTGLNLQHSQARMAVFYEITTCGADFFQSKYRIRRPLVSPKGGFQYLYAVPKDPIEHRRVMRQFAKLAGQKLILEELKAASKGN